jgi:HEXXH motif-containing protein
VLDLGSELPERARLGLRGLASPTAVERDVAVAKLEAALEMLDRIAPLANDLVLRVVDVACCRSAASEPRLVVASDATSLGVVHLVNLHLPQVSTIDVASALVREAVNQALYRWELHHPLLRSSEDITLRSPWTGVPQDLYSFVHGCFAWYAVASLWRHQGSPRPDFDAEAGFSRRPLTYLGDLATHVAPSVAAAIDDMTHAIVPANVRRVGTSRPRGW